MKRFLRVHETAEMLGVCCDTIRRFSDEGKLPCLRDVSNQRRFDIKAVERFKKEFLKKD